MTTSPLHSNDAWDGGNYPKKLADGDFSIKYGGTGQPAGWKINKTSRYWKNIPCLRGTSQLIGFNCQK